MDPPKIIFSTPTEDPTIDDRLSVAESVSDIEPDVRSHPSNSRRNSKSLPNNSIINNRLSIFSDYTMNSYDAANDDEDDISVSHEDAISIDSEIGDHLQPSSRLQHSPIFSPHENHYNNGDDASEDPLDILDTALNGAWMPNTEKSRRFSASPTKPMISYSRESVNDIEANHANLSTNSIPLKNLNIPRIQVDNYLESPQAPTRNIQSPYISQPEKTLNLPVNRLGLNSSTESLSNSLKSSATPVIESKYSRMWFKVSNIINADSPLTDSKEYDEKGDPDDDEQEDEEFNDLQSFNSTTANPFLDDQQPRISSSYKPFNYDSESDDEESIYNFYFDEIENQHQNQNQNDDIVSILAPNLSIHPDTNLFQDSPKENAPTSENQPTCLFGNTLKYFRPNSKFRIFAAKIVTHKFMSIVSSNFIVFQVALLSVQQWEPRNGYFEKGGNSWIDWVIAVLYSFYTIEMALKIITFGLYDDSQMIKALKIQRHENRLQKFYKKTLLRLKTAKFYNKLKNPLNKSDLSGTLKMHASTFPSKQVSNVPKHMIRYAYLRTGWNRVDFVSIISFWIVLGVSFDVENMKKVQIFRALMCLRILRLLNVTRGSRIILRGLRDAAVQSKDVILFLLFFWLIFAIIGVEAFRSSLRRQCLWINPDDSSDTYLNEFQFCGSYLDSTTLKILPYLNSQNISSGVTKGFACPANSVCRIGDNPYNGKVSFDNIFTSMQAVFVIISANTFTDLMYYTMNSDSMAASLFFIISLFILVVWLVNLLVAVIIHSHRTEDKLRKEEVGWFEKRRIIYSKLADESSIIRRYRQFDFIPVSIIFIGFVYSCTKAERMSKVLPNYNLGEFIVSVIMMVEIVIRFGVYIAAGSWRAFFFSRLNLFDLVLAVLALIFSLPPVYHSISAMAYGWLSVFSIMRFYRAVMFVKPLRDAWGLAFKKAKPFAELIMFGIKLVYFAAIIMSRLFEGVIPSEDTDITPWIMNNLPNTIVTLFIITSTENWTQSLYSAQQHATSFFNSICYSVFLILWFMISNTVLLSIFIAIITGGLELPEAEKKINQIRQFIKFCIARTQSHPDEGLFEMVKGVRNGTVSDEANEFIKRMNEILVSSGHEPINVDDFKDGENSSFKVKMKFIKKKLIEITYYDDFILFLTKKKNEFMLFFRYINPLDESENEVNEDEDKDSERARLFLHGTISSYNLVKRADTVDRSLFIFTNENPTRRICQMFITPFGPPRREGRPPNVRLAYCFNVFLFISSVVVVVFSCYETPLYRVKIGERYNYNWMLYFEIVFMAIFTTEFIMKIVADGLLFGPRAYAKSAWNLIDFIVLISFWVTAMSVVMNDFNSAVTFSAAIALRAFRLLTITRESKEVFQIAVLSGSFKILSAALVSLSLLIPFALWGLNIFSNELSTCVDGVSNVFNCSMEYSNEVFKWEIYSPNYVEVPYLHFDDFSSSVQSLFEILSLEGWTDILENIVSITQFGEPSQLFASPGNGFFVIFFIFVSIILIINLFIAIIINNYSVKTGVEYLNNEQYGWYEVKKVLSKVRPSKRRPKFEASPFNRMVFKIVTQHNGIWQWTFRTLLGIHLLTLVSEAYPSTKTADLVRRIVQSIDLFGLSLHFVLSPIAFGFRQFYSNKFNIFMCLISLSALTFSLISLNVNYNSTLYDVYKVFLVIELMLIIPQIDSLTQLFKYGSTSLFSLVTILYTWLILFLVFAIALNKVFGLTRLGPNTNGNLNARTVTKALIMLFRNSFGEGWNYTMVDFEVSAPYCYDGGNGNSDCGNPVIAKFLFIVWNILSMYIFCNILISVVINSFSYVYHGSGPHKLITRDEIRKFKRVWNKFDIFGSGYIYEKDLFEFLHSLDGILSYHVYPKYISIPAIQKRVLVDTEDSKGYDFQINLTKLEEALSLIDFARIRKRRFRYNRLIAEILAAAMVIKIDNFDTKSNNVIRKIPFSNTLLCIGYYARFEDSTCLNLEDFLRHSSQIRIIDKKNSKEKFIATMKTVYTRLKYLQGVKRNNIFQQIKDAPTEYEKENIKKKFRANLVGKDIDFDILIEKIDAMYEHTSVFDQELFKVTSAGSRNPFSDIYASQQPRDPFDDRGSYESDSDEGNAVKR